MGLKFPIELVWVISQLLGQKAAALSTEYNPTVMVACRAVTSWARAAGAEAAVAARRTRRAAAARRRAKRPEGRADPFADTA